MSHQVQPSGSEVSSEVPQSERDLAMLCHLLSLSGYVVPMAGIVAPLVLWLLKREEMPFLDQHGKEVMNFQISMLIYSVVAAILAFAIVGFFLLLGLVVLHIVVTIQGAVAAREGRTFDYPFTLRLIE